MRLSQVLAFLTAACISVSASHSGLLALSLGLVIPPLRIQLPKVSIHGSLGISKLAKYLPRVTIHATKHDYPTYAPDEYYYPEYIPLDDYKPPPDDYYKPDYEYKPAYDYKPENTKYRPPHPNYNKYGGSASKQAPSYGNPYGYEQPRSKAATNNSSSAPKGSYGSASNQSSRKIRYYRD